MPFSPRRVFEARGSMARVTFAFKISLHIPDAPVAENAIASWESGRTKPSLDTFEALLKATGKPMEFFFEETPIKAPVRNRRPDVRARNKASRDSKHKSI